VTCCPAPEYSYPTYSAHSKEAAVNPELIVAATIALALDHALFMPGETRTWNT